MQMVGGKSNCVYVNCRSRPYYSRRCKGKSSVTNIESLPDELLFQILLELSAEDIYQVARFVCKKWHKMVCNRKFVDAHLHHSTPGLLIGCLLHPEHGVLLAMRRGRIEVSKFSYKLKGRVGASCNGLLSEFTFNKNKSRALYIANPATKQHFALPPVSCQVGTDCCSYLEYAKVSKQYKAVMFHVCKYKPLVIRTAAILTVGVDNSWRHLDEKQVLTAIPLIGEGFIHWPSIHGTHVVTLNVETEIITETEMISETPIPACFGPKQGFKYYLSTGSFHTMLIELSKFSWDVLKMKSETAEWTKVGKIDMEPLKCKVNHLVGQSRNSRLRPVGWLNYPEVLVLNVSSSRVCILYNIRKQEIDFFALDHDSVDHNFKVHRNSLVWFGE